MTSAKLGDVLDKIIDCEHKTAPETIEEVYAYSVGTPHLKEGRILYSQAKPISQETYLQWTKRGEPEAGDLILAREAPVGQVGLVGNVRVALGQRTVLLKVNKKLCVPRYLHYKLISPRMQRLMQVWSEGSTVAHLNVKDIPKLDIGNLPPLSEQRRVAEILGSLDDKIEANNALLNSLDGLGNALILQKINDVSETCQLSEVAEIVMGQSPAGETLNEDSEGLIFYQGRRDFGFRYPTPRVFTSAPTRVAEPGDILLSVRAPVGDLNRTDEECCVGRGVAAIRAKNGNTAQLFYLLKNIPSLWSPYEGEGTVFSSINRKQVQNLQIPVVDNFEEFEDIEKSILSLTQENLALSETRDLLIRKLIK